MKTRTNQRTNVEHGLIVCVWYGVVLLYYWHNLRMLSITAVSGYGTDDIIWESTFAFTVLITGFLIGCLRPTFSAWERVKEGLLHLMTLGGTSLGILYLMFPHTFLQSFNFWRVPLFTVAGALAFTGAAFAGYAYRIGFGVLETAGMQDRASGDSKSSESHKPHVVTVVVSVIGSVIASAVSGGSGWLIKVLFAP